MKFYSEKLDTLFDTPEALNEAEGACNCGGQCEKETTSGTSKTCGKKKVKKDDVSTTKKQLAADVDAAESKVREAYAEYEVAKKQIEELSKTYLESVEAILNPAKEKVRNAEKERYNAIRKFTDSYGSYQVTLTGDRAAKEMIRAINDINSIQRKIFNNTFWF